MPHMLKSHIKDAEVADKAEGSCYMSHVMSQGSQKYKSGHSPVVINAQASCTSLFYGRTQKKKKTQSTEDTVKYSMAQLISW